MNSANEKLLRITRLSIAVVAVLCLTACESFYLSKPKHLKPVSQKLKFSIEQRNMRVDSPILVRIFKEENELEVWKENKQGNFAHLTTYDICAWSGELGPKFREGDRQSPEGFYSVKPGQMNPNSSYHLSYNIGYPNTFDRSQGRTGSHIMVHGNCTSRGCFAMGDKQIEQIYALAREAFRGGQSEFQIQSYPFRMTASNLARNFNSPHYEFWKNLKEGYDHFEISKKPPDVNVCDKKYVFNAIPIKSGQQFLPAAACPDYSIPSSIAGALEYRQKKLNKVLEFETAKIESQEKSILLAFLNPDHENAENE